MALIARDFAKGPSLLDFYFIIIEKTLKNCCIDNMKVVYLYLLLRDKLHIIKILKSVKKLLTLINEMIIYKSCF